MIIHLKGKNQNGQMQFNLVPYKFQENDYLQVNQVVLKLKRPSNGILMTISSSLVDQSQFNPSQQILQFYCNENSGIIFHEPTHLTKYKIQRNDLETAEFVFSANKNVEITEIYLQIEITNAGLQQFNQE